jgi:predicted nucleotidyltransferase
MQPVASMLAERFGIRRVVLFGSAALGTDRPVSDVDLAVEGRTPADYFAAFHSLEVELGVERLDLGEIEQPLKSWRSR